MKKIFVLSLICLLLFPSSIIAASSTDLLTDLVPNIDEDNVQAKYTEYPISHYRLDVDVGFLDVLTPTLNFLLNIAFMIYVFYVRVVIMLLEQSFTLDLLNMIADEIDQWVGVMRSSIYDQFVIPMISIVGIYILFTAIIASRRTKSWSVLVTTVVILIISGLFFSSPSKVLITFNEVSKQTSASILNGTAPLVDRKAKTINDSVVVAGNQIWDNMVVKPWYLLQFGSIEEGMNKKDDFLPYSPFDDIRIANVEDEAKTNDLMTYKGFIERYILLFTLQIYGQIYLAILLILSVLVLITQLLPLVQLSFAGIILLLALIPNYGFRVIQKWFERIAGAIFYKVVISVFLSVLLTMGSFFYTVFDGVFFMQMVVQIIVAVVVIMERQRIFGIFKNITKGPDVVGEIAAQKSNYGGRSLDFTKKIGGKALSVGMFAAGAVTGGSTAMMVMGGKSAVLGSAVNKVAGKFQKKKMSAKADNFLHYKYNHEKDNAEKIAEDKGTTPVYSPFVNQVEANRERGLPLYTTEQRESAVNELVDINKQGGNVGHIYNPVGVRTSDPVQYRNDVTRHQDRLNQKRTKFEADRSDRINLIVQSENLENYVPEKPVPVSEKTKEIQQGFKNFTQSKVELDQKSTIDVNHKQKINLASQLAKPNQPIEYKHELTSAQKQFKDTTEKIQQFVSTENGEQRNSIDVKHQHKIDKAASLSKPNTPHPPEKKKRPKPYKHNLTSAQKQFKKATADLKKSINTETARDINPLINEKVRKAWELSKPRKAK